MTLLSRLEVVVVPPTAGVVERSTLVGVLVKPPASKLVTAGARLNGLPADLGGLQDLLLVTTRVLTRLNTCEPDTIQFVL